MRTIDELLALATRQDGPAAPVFTWPEALSEEDQATVLEWYFVQGFAPRPLDAWQVALRFSALPLGLERG